MPSNTKQSRSRLHKLAAQLATFTSPLHTHKDGYYTISVNGVIVQRTTFQFWLRHELIREVGEDCYEVVE